MFVNLMFSQTAEKKTYLIENFNLNTHKKQVLELVIVDKKSL